jgi:hypothetical protein
LLLVDGSLPEGRLSEDSEMTLGSAAIGGAAGYAVIWRDEVLSPMPYTPWALDFPVGYSCGELVPAPAGETFDSFRPIPCSEVEIRIDRPDALDFGNWT